MIPAVVEAHLRQRYAVFEHHVHASAFTAQELAAADHVSGYRVAKLVVLKLRGTLAIAVVAATDRVNLHPLEEAMGTRAELAPEAEFQERFRPCEPGAEPPLAVFGIPIYVDDKLIRERTILVPAGTHEDAVILDTSEWLWCEKVRPIMNLGQRALRDVSSGGALERKGARGASTCSKRR
jgi:Ala-tRNA(Pro) deacylase